MSKKPTITETAIVTDLNSDQLPGHVARFHLFHGLVCKSALEMKLAKYFAGLEANAVYDLHAELHGETRGRPSGEEITEGASVISLEPFLEQHLGVTARTARKYRSHFLSITDKAPEVAKKLNEVWQGLSKQDAQALPAPGELASTIQPLAMLDENSIKLIIEHADEWELNKIFEVPLRDVGPESEDGGNDESQIKKAQKAAIVSFWTVGLVRRLDQEEFLRLSPTDLEAVTAKLEDAIKRAKETLAAKAAKKKKGKKA